MASEKSSRARVEVRSKRPPPKILVTRRASSSVVMAVDSPQVARGPAVVARLVESGLLHEATIEGMRASRMKCASGREVAQQRNQPRNAAECALLVERGEAR